LNLAVCHEKEGRIASSWGEFHQALTEARRGNRPDRIQLAEDAIKRVEEDLPFVAIIVPASARVPGLEIKAKRRTAPGGGLGPRSIRGRTRSS
jgi:hypothetical protein